ncbi:MAG: antibiotic biosynthesis monooxygenase [Herbinix sp.]|jgi:quinol monooxygenase YgiN|nr:antibiotic biosynthesis monooxygenase [Herbinix sp.]
MIKVVAKNKVMDDKIEHVIKLYEELVIETRKEVGCITYDLFQDVKDPSVVTMIEEWESQEKLDAHMITEHFKKIVPMVGEFVLQGEVNIYQQVY